MPNINRNADGGAPLTGGAADDDFEKPKDYVLTIGVVARMFGISRLALRLYEWRGLIARHKAGCDHVYSWSDCERIALIVKTRAAGLRVGDFDQVIAAMDAQSAVTATETGRRSCFKLIDELEVRQRALGRVLSELYRIDWELSERLGLEPAHKSSKKLTSFE